MPTDLPFPVPPPDAGGYEKLNRYTGRQAPPSPGKRLQADDASRAAPTSPSGKRAGLRPCMESVPRIPLWSAHFRASETGLPHRLWSGVRCPITAAAGRHGDRPSREPSPTALACICVSTHCENTPGIGRKACEASPAISQAERKRAATSLPRLAVVARIVLPTTCRNKCGARSAAPGEIESGARSSASRFDQNPNFKPACGSTRWRVSSPLRARLAAPTSGPDARA